MPAERICVAQIGAPHGVRGEVRLFAYTEDPLTIARYGPLQSEDGSLMVEIASVRPAKTSLVARVRGVDDRSAAEKLLNVRLYIDRSRLPETEDADTFYHADLVGLAAVTQDGVVLGHVTAVQNFGAGDILEIAPADDGPTLLLPFTTATVPMVDLANGRIVIDPPGTLENETEADRTPQARRKAAAKRSGQR